uniref:Uncharacterized protein n=1 Tax=Arundo donax TaxID=35708 RepID=A0A0A9BD90_ARUDO
MPSYWECRHCHAIVAITSNQQTKPNHLGKVT